VPSPFCFVLRQSHFSSYHLSPWTLLSGLREGLLANRFQARPHSFVVRKLRRNVEPSRDNSFSLNRGTEDNLAGGRAASSSSVSLPMVTMVTIQMNNVVQHEKMKKKKKYHREIVLCNLDTFYRSTELCLTKLDGNLEFPWSMDLLNDPDIWIADSGCSIHCTGFEHGMDNIVTHGNQRGDGYVHHDGSENVSLATGDIPVVCYDKYGMEVGQCRLPGVNYVKGQRFNLFSKTKLQSDGWIPGGDLESLWFTRHDTDFVVRFDIKIPTRRGCVFAACFLHNIFDFALLSKAGSYSSSSVK
jgi:hypothetical protein